MKDVSKTDGLIAEARRLPEQFKKVQLSEGQYLEDDALAELDAVGFVAVDTARRLADALEAATRVPVQGEPNGDREALIAAMGQPDFPGSSGAHLGMREALSDWFLERTIAALDGAPEPEAVEWEYGLRKPLDAVPRMTGSESLMQGYQEIHGGNVYKRTAPGPWLPVEGESE